MKQWEGQMLAFSGHVAGLLKSAADLPPSPCVPKSPINESPAEPNTERQLWATNTNSKISALHVTERTELKKLKYMVII